MRDGLRNYSRAITLRVVSFAKSKRAGEVRTVASFLDIAWIEKKLPNAAEHIKKKLPSMYHQFKQLADIDITKEPMESARRRIT
jgi:succinate dehydrogenase/fumarate reductase flavoprotein subunit